MTPVAPLRRLTSRQVYRSQWMSVRADQVAFQNGSVSEYGVVERRDFVLVIPRRTHELLLVRQYRYPIDQWTLEFPQGAVDSETPEDSCRRELQEETGALASRIQRLGRFYEASAYATHACDVYVADVTSVGEAKPELSESAISAQWLSIQSIQQMIREGRIQDSSSLAAWALARETGILEL
jgi:ADP-ribose pyrophosphatase